MILMNDFKAEPAGLLRKELEAAERVLKSGWFILGKEVQQFEGAWAKYCGTDFAVGVANGMDAIEIGLRALEIGPGDEVITAPMTAMATVLAILRTGATPVFADIDLATALLDLESARRSITDRTKAILLVHLYGRINRMDEWVELCRSHKIHLLEDGAQAHGAEWMGRRAGTFGAWGAYSFYPTKNLGARGDAGAVVTNSKEIADRAQRLRNYGQSQRYHHPNVGLNSRLDELQAAILLVRLEWLDAFNETRRKIADRYWDEITNPKIELLARPPAREQHVQHLFVLRCSERDRLAEHLKATGIETLIHYPLPMHQQRPCVHLQTAPLPNTELHAQQCLSIPCHPQLSEEAVSTVIRCLNGFA